MSPSPDEPGGEPWGGDRGRLEVLGTFDAREFGGISEEEQAELHHVGFNRALEDARRQMQEDSQWHGRTVRLRFEVWLTKNPGAVGEYRVWGTSP